MARVFITVDSDDESREFDIDVADSAALIERLEFALLEWKLEIEEES